MVRQFLVVLLVLGEVPEFEPPEPVGEMFGKVGYG
jgi:hypothetical protein